MTTSNPPEAKPLRSRSAVVRWLALFSLAFAGCYRAPSEPAQGRNVILLSLDTLRADRLGLYGYDRETSPTLDGLAKESLVFERAIAQSSHTQPSHQSLLQSREPGKLGDAMPVLPELLEASGYVTVAFTGGGFVSEKWGFDRGFQVFETFPAGLGDSLPAFENWLNSTAASPDPFFAFLHTYDVHVPYDPAPEFDLFEPQYEGRVVPEVTTALQTQAVGISGPPKGYEDFEWNEADRRRYSALYDGKIRQTDNMVKSLLDLLLRSTKWNPSRDVLVILSDHGEEFWDHGSIGHGFTLYEELIRVPLIIRLPGARKGGTRISRPVELMDVSPTILHLLNIERPPQFLGRSLLPAVSSTPEGDDLRWTEVSVTVGNQRSISQFPWKLVVRGEDGEIELFDLKSDPGETMSVAEQRPDIVDHLQQLLASRMSQAESSGSSLVDEESVDDPELLEQLRSLGYLP